jgi:hypothetical protein
VRRPDGQRRREDGDRREYEERILGPVRRPNCPRIGVMARTGRTPSSGVLFGRVYVIRLVERAFE